MASALIVGAGASGFLHALALRSAGVRVAAVVDPDRAAARNLAELVGADALHELSDARRHDVTIAAICSPPVHHVAQARALADGRRLVFVEKPVALSEVELDVLRALPRVVPIVQWRAGRSAHELRAALAAGTFGPQPRIDCELRLWRDDAYFASRDAERWGAGALLSIGIHALDLVLWIAGRRVVGSSGHERFGRSELDVATAGEVTLALEGGASARVTITVDAPSAGDVRLAVAGAGRTAYLHAGEADPTGAPLTWLGAPAQRSGAGAERAPAPAAIGGSFGSPLLVPFIHDALAAATPLSIADVATAHSVAYEVTSRSARRVPCRRPA